MLRANLTGEIAFMGFEILGVSDEIMAAVSDAGYTEPTPIQRQAIPSILQGRDILGIAQTGTGKTAGFTLPMIDILAQGRARARMPRSLILEPTRELAAQVAENFETYGKNHKLSMALLIGGVSFGDQVTALNKGADVLIATPGRLLDHFERGKLMLNGVEILVVDEADRMLDMGFIPDVERICKLMPQRHQNLFFSATMPPPVKKLTDQFLNDPKLIEVARPATTAETVEQRIVEVAPRAKNQTLRDLLNSETVQNALIFCNRKKDVKEVFSSLRRHGFDVGQLHGDMSQPERMDMLARYKDGQVKLLVASDVAARGLDISTVSHVFNFDVPTHADDYVHRVGRTGRAGREGKSFTFATRAEAKYVEAIEKLIGSKIKRANTSGNQAAPEPKAKQDAKSENRSKDVKPSSKNPAPTQKKDPEKEPRKPAQGKSGNKGRNQDHPPKEQDHSPKENGPVVGLGSHVPAFLMTAPPKKRR